MSTRFYVILGACIVLPSIGFLVLAQIQDNSIAVPMLGIGCGVGVLLAHFWQLLAEQRRHRPKTTPWRTSRH